VLRDESRSAREVITLGGATCPRPTATAPVRLGGNGPVTTLVTGAFTFGAAPPNVLLESLPPTLHAPAGDPRMSPQLAVAAQLILAESAAPGPGSSILSARLAEILLIHALRARVAARETGDDHRPGLCALADPAIGVALRLIHARPAENWTVERLAREVAMSRSAFAARFTELVGEPPMHYVARWRMHVALTWLGEDTAPLAELASRLGYQSEAAFSRAFKRAIGISPGAARQRGEAMHNPREHQAFRRRGSAHRRARLRRDLRSPDPAAGACPAEPDRPGRSGRGGAADAGQQRAVLVTGDQDAPTAPTRQAAAVVADAPG
jgi:AraC-like DNA-binding protein